MAINIDDLLRRAVDSRASDLHLKVGNHPYLRVDGLLSGLTDVPRITPEEMQFLARVAELGKIKDHRDFIFILIAVRYVIVDRYPRTERPL